MRTTTRVWASCESIGKPEFNQRFDGVLVSEFVIGFAQWMTAIHMGKYVKIIIARSQPELDHLLSRGAGTQDAGSKEDMMSILEGLMAQSNLALDVDPEPEIFDVDSES